MQVFPTVHPHLSQHEWVVQHAKLEPGRPRPPEKGETGQSPRNRDLLVFRSGLLSQIDEPSVAGGIQLNAPRNIVLVIGIQSLGYASSAPCRRRQFVN